MLPELNAERMKYIFMNMDDAVCMTGRAGQLLFANPAAEKLFGLKRWENGRIWDVIPYVPGNDELIQLFIDGVTERKAVNSLVDYVNNEGNVFQLHVSLTKETDETGLVLIVISDLTRLVKVRNAFERYTSPEIANYVLATPEGEKQGGQARDVSILMSDLRGFTALSTRLDSKDLITMLNHYFEYMNAAIERHGGTVIEFLGDGIFVVFGAPADLPGHAAAAVTCAVEMQNAMKEVNAWNREMNYPELEMGIAVHSGTAIVGNIGSEKKMKYGCMGEVVNLAGRIESLSIGGQVLISEITRDRIAEPLQIASEQPFMPKGARKEIRVFEVAGIGTVRLAGNGKETKWTTPAEKCEVLFRELQGKSVEGDWHSGELTRISEDEKYGMLDTRETLAPMQNLLIRIGDADTYAKVLNAEGKEYRFCFTTKPANLFKKEC